MSDAFEMRLRLQQVAAYRELCRGVRRSGRENVVFACVMMFLAYLASQGPGGARPFVIALYAVLVGGELLVGLFKWLFPSAEGILLDGVVLLIFAAFNLGLQYWALQNGGRLDPVIIFLGLFMLMGAVGRFKSYGQLRRLFAERPSAEHMAWFDELVHEIRAADPQADELALDLATRPHWKVKLFGTTVFFVSARGSAVWVAGPDDFEILREKADRGTGRRRALLRVHGRSYPEFEIADASWSNYQKWRAANPLPQSPSPAVGGLG
jgi:hypothetical protein